MKGPLADASRRAASDAVLGRNVLRATNASLAHRATAVAERPDWDQLRDRAARLKDHALTNLDVLLDRFVTEATRRGAIVHLETDAEAARRRIVGIVRDAGGRHVLKSKSMTTEEIDLNPALEAAGAVPLETDLGEFIVQLAGEPPSHITAPALHRSAEEILDLFRKHGVLEGAGEPPAERKDLPTWLSLAARAHLRARLLAADVGVTGANALVADTGTVVLLENEGNIRYTLLSPRVQIAVAGIEKLVPRLEDLATILPLLTRSATGQRMTTYVSMLSGPVSGALHVVLIDNGRTRMLGNDAEREILRCIRCGACMNVCPVYRTIGGHAYGAPYPGPIGAVLVPTLRGRDDDQDLPWASSLCGACADVCPVKIDLPAHLVRLRARAVARGRAGGLESAGWRVWRYLVGDPRRLEALARLARPFQGLLSRGGPLGVWRRGRAVPRLARRSFFARWRRDGRS